MKNELLESAPVKKPINVIENKERQYSFWIEGNAIGKIDNFHIYYKTF